MSRGAVLAGDRFPTAPRVWLILCQMPTALRSQVFSSSTLMEGRELVQNMGLDLPKDQDALARELRELEVLPLDTSLD